MEENRMRIYLAELYDENNHTKNWLRYWLKGYETPNRDKVEWRKNNDLDCLYFNGDLNADTIISIWMIMSTVLKYIHKNINISKSKKDIEILLCDFDKYFPKENKLIETLEILCMKAETRANFMLLPNRSMQSRGLTYADQVPATLYQCFPDGKYSSCFSKQGEDEKISLEKWIEREKLIVAFKDNEIKRENIIPISKELTADKCIKGTKKENLIWDLINYSIEFLDKRYILLEGF